MDKYEKMPTNSGNKKGDILEKNFREIFKIMKNSEEVKKSNFYKVTEIFAVPISNNKN